MKTSFQSPVRTSVMVGWVLTCGALILFFDWIARPFGGMTRYEYQFLIGILLLVTAAVILGILINPTAMGFVSRSDQPIHSRRRLLGFTTIICGIAGCIMVVWRWS